MKRKGYPFRILLLLLLLGPVSAFSQDITGIWKGYFITETGEQYRLEFQVAITETGSVQGVSYSYLDTRFYGKAIMIGNYKKKEKVLHIQELRTVEVKQEEPSSGTCLMNYKFVFSRSGREQFLEGTYIGRNENRANPALGGKWGSCGGGKVRLRLVEESDFYVEPFVKESLARKNNPKLKPVTPAQQKPPVAKTTTPARTKPAEVKPKKSAPVIQRPVTTIQQDAPVVKTEAPKIKPRIIPIPQQTNARQNDLTKTLDVTHAEITIKLYDNGEVDDDTVSVYLDDRVILAHKRLTAAPITFTLQLDENIPEHTVIMVAENLGRIPPNTALMVVYDGEKRYQVNITSTEQKNGMVRFRYQKPAP